MTIKRIMDAVKAPLNFIVSMLLIGFFFGFSATAGFYFFVSIVGGLL